MKKIVSLLSILILLAAGSSAAFAGDYSGTLTAVGILSEPSRNSMQPVSREEFSYMAARLFDAEQRPTATAFTDVDETNIYSGYIHFLSTMNIVSGDSEGRFNPKADTTYAMAAKILVCALGYEAFADSLGGYPNGYSEVLSRLRLDKGIKIAKDGVLTIDAAEQLIHNVLVTDIGNVVYYADGRMTLETSKGESTSILAERFGISVFEGTVTEVNDAGTQVTVAISESKYAANPITLTEGTPAALRFQAKASAKAYRHVPCVIWVNMNREIVQITPQADVKIRYATIAEVNRTDQDYPIANIREMKLLDDETEYSVKNNAVLRYNGSITNKTVPLYNRFAKVVMQSDEVVFIESWDLTDGGLITKADGNTIAYMKKGQTHYLRDVSSIKDVEVIIGNRAAYLNEIKTDSLFSYYKKGDTLVMVVSEKKIADVFTGISPSAVTIGHVSYDKGDVYYSEDGVNFDKISSHKLLGRTVTAYISPTGYVWIVKALHTDEKDNARRKIYGIIKGVKMENMNPDFGQVKVIEATDELSESTLYLTDKTKYEIELSSDILAANASNLKGEGIYVFEVNASGRVLSVQKPEPVYGYFDTDISLGYFTDVAMVSLAPHYLSFSRTQPILAVYEKNGTFTAGWTSWAELYDHQATAAVKVRFFGENKSDTPSLIVMASGAGSLSELGTAERYGVVTQVSDVLGENGDACRKISVIMANGNKDYVVTAEYAKENHLTANAVIRFREDTKYNDNEMILLSDDANPTEKYNRKLSDNPEAWQLPAGWEKGIVYAVSSKRLLIQNEDAGEKPSAVLFHPNYNFIAVFRPGAANTKFSLAAWDEIDIGDTVYYNKIGDGTRGVIVVKQ